MPKYNPYLTQYRSESSDASSYPWENMQPSATSSFAPHPNQQQRPPNAPYDSHQRPPLYFTLGSAEKTPPVTCHQSQSPEAPPIDPSTWPYNQLGMSGGITQRDQHTPLFLPTPDVPRQYPLTQDPTSSHIFHPTEHPQPFCHGSHSSSIHRDRPGDRDYVESRAPLPSMSPSGRHSPRYPGYSGNNGNVERGHNGQPSYRCRWNVDQAQCNSDITGSRRCIERHLRDFHNVEKDISEVICLWEGCKKQPMKRENLARHLRTHMGIQHICPHCGKKYSREDAVRRHLDHVYRDKNLHGRAIAVHYY